MIPISTKKKKKKRKGIKYFQKNIYVNAEACFQIQIVG